MSLPRPLPRRAVYGACDDVRRPVGNHRTGPGSELARRTARPHGGRRGPRRAHRRAAAQPAQSAARARVDHARVPRRAHIRLRRIGRHGAALPRTSRRSRRAGPGAHHPGALRHAPGRDAGPGLVRRRQGRLSERSWDELAFAPALELAARVRAGELSSVELVELYLDRIARLDPELNAYVTVDADG